MAVYVHDRWLLADGWVEARRFLRGIGVSMPDHRLLLAGTHRWCFEIRPIEYEWAVTAGALEFTLAQVQQLVDARIRTEDIGRVPAPDRDPAGRRRTWSRTARHHWWDQREPHIRRCLWCGLITNHRKVEPQMLGIASIVCLLGAWFTEWQWPTPGPVDEYDGHDLDGTTMPRCPGPRVGGP